MGLLYYRLILRGWDRPTISQFILEAVSRTEQQPPPAAQSKPTTDHSAENTLFLHFQFHKNGVSRRTIRTLYDKHLGNFCQADMDIQRMIVAFSRPKNIGDFLTKAKLYQAPGQSASTILGEFKKGLDPS